MPIPDLSKLSVSQFEVGYPVMAQDIQFTNLNKKYNNTGVFYHVIENELKRESFVDGIAGLPKIMSVSFLHPRVKTKGVYTSDPALVIDPELVHRIIAYSADDMHSGDPVSSTKEGVEPPQWTRTRYLDDPEYMHREIKFKQENNDGAPLHTDAANPVDIKSFVEQMHDATLKKNYSDYNEVIIEVRDKNAVIGSCRAPSEDTDMAQESLKEHVSQMSEFEKQQVQSVLSSINLPDFSYKVDADDNQPFWAGKGWGF